MEGTDDCQASIKAIERVLWNETRSADRIGVIDAGSNQKYTCITIDPRTTSYQGTDEFLQFLEKYMLKKDAPVPPKSTEAVTATLSLSDAEILEKARNATNGEKFKILFDSGNIYQYESQVSVYAVKICAPAERKSEVDRHATRPIIKFSAQYNSTHKIDISRSRAELKMKQKALTAAEKAKDGDCDRLFEAQQAVDSFKEISSLTLIADDTTIEALITLMTKNNERMLIASDEGGIFSHIKGRYKQNGDDIELYLKAHSGARVSVHRKSREPETLENPALSLCISVQPYIAENAILDDENTGRGLTARLVFACCDEKAGTRGAVSTPMNPATMEQYESAIDKCLSRTINSDIAIESDYNTINIVTLSEEARRFAIIYFDTCEKRIIDGLEGAKGWNGKCFGLSIRIAGLFHSFECMERGLNPWDVPIASNTMKNSALLTEVLAKHAEKIFTGTDRKNNHALYLLKKLLGLLGSNSEINKQAVWQNVKGKFANTEAFDEALQTLEENDCSRGIYQADGDHIMIMTIEEARDILRLDGDDNDHIILPLIEAIPPYLTHKTGYSTIGDYFPIARTAARFILQLWYFGEHGDVTKLERVIDCLLKSLSAERCI